MSDETPESLIPYDEIVQEALRDVVGRVLGEVEQSGGLPGEHHFYITFKTRLPGVEIPKHLLERFPEEMTIVIQHRFWDLKVEQNAFSVGLSFGGVPARLLVPFAAVTDLGDFFSWHSSESTGAAYQAPQDPARATPATGAAQAGRPAPRPLAGASDLIRTRRARRRNT
jgi:hypothetical protein